MGRPCDDHASRRCWALGGYGGVMWHVFRWSGEPGMPPQGGVWSFFSVEYPSLGNDSCDASTATHERSSLISARQRCTRPCDSMPPCWMHEEEYSKNASWPRVEASTLITLQLVGGEVDRVRLKASASCQQVTCQSTGSVGEPCAIHILLPQVLPIISVHGRE